MLPMVNTPAVDKVRSLPANRWLAVPEALIRVMTKSDVPMARCIPMPLNITSAGTMMNPPPTPNSPDSTPAPKPTMPSSMAHCEVRRSLPSGSRRHVGPALSSMMIGKLSR